MEGGGEPRIMSEDANEADGPSLDGSTPRKKFVPEDGERALEERRLRWHAERARRERAVAEESRADAASRA